MNALAKLVEFLCRLENEHIHYTLEHNRDEAIMVLIAEPGERWEVEFFVDGHVEVEVFRSTGMEDETALDRLFRPLGD